ncbi:hypothetical protein Pla175_27750 [Pirellulimonas nuda]|uniref:Uncharacterized protein n=1 Tax=Pirellulimonas nuda TaxID=2528009 RepID=A0A518DD23_9BACT|nr:hypothetical protein [Pirellulimonas nuda]QDU89385.1 hypothetical protein Pla175_27750 [Pirellulimonas nuda]
MDNYKPALSPTYNGEYFFSDCSVIDDEQEWLEKSARLAPEEAEAQGARRAERMRNMRPPTTDPDLIAERRIQDDLRGYRPRAGTPLPQRIRPLYDCTPGGLLQRHAQRMEDAGEAMPEQLALLLDNYDRRDRGDRGAARRLFKYLHAHPEFRLTDEPSAPTLLLLARAVCGDDPVAVASLALDALDRVERMAPEGTSAMVRTYAQRIVMCELGVQAAEAKIDIAEIRSPQLQSALNNAEQRLGHALKNFVRAQKLADSLPEPAPAAVDPQAGAATLPRKPR